MSTDNDGVAVYRTTRTTMIEALQQLPVQPPQPEPEPCRRRHMPLSRTPAAVTPPAPHRVTCPLDVADLADAILLNLPEAEPAPLKAIAEAERVIAAKDETIADLRGAVDDAAAASHDIDLVLDGVPGLSQDHPGQAGAVAELAERCKAAEAQNVTLREALAGGHLLELADLRAKVAEYENAIAWNTSCTACARTLDSSIAEHERADKAERILAPLASALERFAAPGAWTSSKRQQAAREALAAAQAPPEPVVPADPYQGLGSGGMIP